MTKNLLISLVVTSFTLFLGTTPAQASLPLDLDSPTTTITASCATTSGSASISSGDTCNGNSISYTLSCDDGNSLNSTGCKNTYYKFSPPYTSFSQYFLSQTYTNDITSHTISGYSEDNAGNSASASPTSFNFIFAPTPTPIIPYLQTTGGDVHINQ